MGDSRNKIGRWGEQLAAEFLRHKDYQILVMNARTEHGEIDIIARQEQALVFIEVKTRTNLAYGLPEHSITAQKQAHLIHSATTWLVEHPELDGLDWRIDVIAVLKQKDSAVQIKHFENALHG